jgi:hypothetical protein
MSAARPAKCVARLVLVAGLGSDAPATPRVEPVTVPYRRPAMLVGTTLTRAETGR